MGVLRPGSAVYPGTPEYRRVYGDGPPTLPLGAKPRAVAAAPAAAPAPAPPVESGTLPGEEQVTTVDTLGQLSADERKQLEAKYQKSGMAGTGGMETLEDWASTHFGEMPPQERLSAMRHAAGMRLPPQTIVPQEEVLPGQNSRLARGVVAAGGVLPEGRDIGQYPKQQAKMAGKNMYNPHAKMTVFGGTNVHNPNGSLSARGIRPGELERVGDPTGPDGQYSDDQIISLGQAYNIDVGQYGNDTDLLRAHVMQEKERHDRLGGKSAAFPEGRYKSVPNNMGGFRYTPTDAMKAQAADQQARLRAQDLLVKYRNMGGANPAEQAQIDRDIASLREIARTGTAAAMPAMVAMGRGLRSDRLSLSAATQRNRLQNETISRDLARPGTRAGQALRSINEALRGGNLAAAAAAAAQYDPALRDGLLALAGAETQAAGQVGVARAANQPKPTIADQIAGQMGPAVGMASPADRALAAQAIVAQAPGNDKLSAEQVQERAQSALASGLAATNPKAPEVQNELKRLSKIGDTAGFFALTTQMGMTQEQSKQMWIEAGSFAQQLHRKWVGP